MSRDWDDLGPIQVYSPLGVWLGGVYREEVDVGPPGPWQACWTELHADGTWRQPVAGFFQTAEEAARAVRRAQGF